MKTHVASISELALSRRAFLGGTLGATALGALTLAGCAPGGSSPAATGGAGTGTVDFTSFVFAQDSAGPLRDTVSAFTKDTGVKVAEVAIPYQQYLDQLVLKARGGNVSGIAHIDEEWLSTLATAGVLKDLSSQFQADLYPDRVASSGVLDKTRYALPWTQSAIGVVGNSGLLDGFGVDMSAVRTTDQFADALRKIKSQDSSIVPYAPCTSVQQLKDIIPWILVFGGTIYDGSEVTLGDRGSVEAVEYWKMLLDEGLIQPGMIREDARKLFAQQRTPLYDDAPQTIGIIPGQSNDPDIASKMHPVARPTGGGDTANLLWSQPLVAFDDTTDTGELLTYLSTDESSLQTMFEATGQPPTTKEALDSDWFAANAFNSEWNGTVASGAVTNPLWTFPSASAAQTVFNEAIEPALAGTVSVKDGLAQAKAGLEELLNG